jgi:hypothetical protein
MLVAIPPHALVGMKHAGHVANLYRVALTN